MTGFKGKGAKRRSPFVRSRGGCSDLRDVRIVIADRLDRWRMRWNGRRGKRMQRLLLMTSLVAFVPWYTSATAASHIGTGCDTVSRANAGANMLPVEEVRNIDGVAYSTFGPKDGVPIVLLHGLGADRTRYRYVVVDLAQSYRVIALDFRGFGRSPLPDVTIDDSTLVRDVIAVMDDAGLEDAHLVGNSMGGVGSLCCSRNARLNVRAP